MVLPPGDRDERGLRLSRRCCFHHGKAHTAVSRQIESIQHLLWRGNVEESLERAVGSVLYSGAGSQKWQTQVELFDFADTQLTFI